MFGNDSNALTVVLRLKDEFSKSLGDASKKLDKFTSDFDNTTASSKKLAFGLGALVTGFVGLAGASIKTSADLETARQGFVTLLGSAEKADAIIAKIKKDAASTPFEIKGLIQANQLLTQVTKDGDRSETLLLNVGKALAAAGKGQPALDMIIANLQQIGNTATISEMDIRQFGNQGVNILELLADQYGVTKAQAGEMVKNSKDAFGDLEKAFAKAGAAGGKFGNAFKDQAGTVNQQLSNLKDNFVILGSEIVNKSGLFDGFKQALSGFNDALTNINVDELVAIFKDKDFQKGLQIVAGAIAAALVPALWAAASALTAFLIPLLPLVAIGGTLVWTIQSLIDIFHLLKEDGDLVLLGFLTTFQEWAAGIMAIPSKIAAVFIGMWEGVKTAFKGAINFMIGLAEGWANGFITAINFIIKGLNKIQFSLPSWIPGIGGKSFGLNIATVPPAKLPRFEHGGTVPGATGQAVPIMAHGQERIIPAGQARGMNDGGGSTYQVIINNPQVRNQADLNAMRSQINDVMRDLIRVHKLETI